jgi:hypothetical protein
MGPVHGPQELAGSPDELPAAPVAQAGADGLGIAARRGSIPECGHPPQDTSPAQVGPHLPVSAPTYPHAPTHVHLGRLLVRLDPRGHIGMGREVGQQASSAARGD